MYCKGCGKKLDSGAKFCAKCGMNNETESGKGQAIASLVIGILSLFFGVVIFPLPIVGLILGCSYKGKCGEKTAGIILNTISLILSIIVTITIIVCMVMFGGRLITGAFDHIDFSKINISVSTDWEKYEQYVDPNDELDSTMTLEGTWKELSEDKKILVFDGIDFSLYYNPDALEQRFDTGKYNIRTGLEVLDGFELSSKVFDKLFDKINKEVEGVNLMIVKVTSLEKHDGDHVEIETIKDEDANGLAIIASHDNVVELVIQGFNGGEEKHFYKIISNGN